MLQSVRLGTGVKVSRVLSATTRHPRKNISLSCGRYCNRPYLEGQKFLVRTDHRSLRWVLNWSDAHGRRARWFLRLLEFYCEVRYSLGKHHHGADTMSQ
jgi:hypothetical protein